TGGGEVAFLRTNSTPEWSEAIVDWQRGGPGGSFLSVTGTPIARIVPVSAERAGEWTVSVQYFDGAGAYLGEPAWVSSGHQTAVARTNVAQLAAQNAIAGAVQYRLRFRIGPADNDGREPGFRFTEIAALADGSTDPLDHDSDDDGMSDGGEWVAGTDGNDPAQYLRLVIFGGAWPEDLVVSWESRTGRLYNVNGAPDLADWQPLHAVSGTGGTLSYTNDPGDQETGFLRLEVERE
ncbi:MAG: hypothetical protein JXB04_10170, partial [Kiritimatiellae bacterium]|nr:hypothetical protein [Kiritimatiellia bacterium]